MAAQDRIRLTGPLRKRLPNGGLFYIATPAQDSVLAFANLPPTSAESPPTYRGERGAQSVGANRGRVPRSAALSARARQLTPQALGKRCRRSTKPPCAGLLPWLPSSPSSPGLLP